MEEMWKDIKGYENLYQVSNLGRIRVLPKVVKCKGGATRTTPGKIMETELNYNGYPSIRLVREGKRMRHRIHILVWEAFGTSERNGKKIVIDHIDNDKTNCRIDNLQLLSGRANVAKAKKKVGRLTGAFFNGRKWFSQVRTGKVCKYIGSFDSEQAAHNAYLKEIELITKKIQ